MFLGHNMSSVMTCVFRWLHRNLYLLDTSKFRLYMGPCGEDYLIHTHQLVGQVHDNRSALIEKNQNMNIAVFLLIY